MYSAKQLEYQLPEGMDTWQGTEGWSLEVGHTSPPCRSSQVLLVHFLTGELAGESQGFAARRQEE